MKTKTEGKHTPGPDEPDDEVKYCPDCERPNQFGELCADCSRDEQEKIEEEQADIDLMLSGKLPLPGSRAGDWSHQ